MIDCLIDCSKSKEIASFYYDQDNTSVYLTGYIERYNEAEILIAHISPHGAYDGFILKRIADIYRIDRGGKYEKKIETLYKAKKQSHAVINTFGPCEEALLFLLLEFAQTNRLILTLELNNSCISGFVNRYKEDIVYIDVIDDYGLDNGLAAVMVDDIDTVALDTDYEQDLLVLSLSLHRS